MSTPETVPETQPEANALASEPAPSPASGPAAVRTNALAIASFALSLSGLTLLAQIAGIITGHMALKQIRETGEAGHGLAKAGLIISYVVVGISILFVVFFVALWGIMIATLFATFGSGDPSMLEYMSYSS